MAGSIIVGYQGIGKSTLSRNENKFIDLESSNLFVDGKRAKDWYISYCNIAINLALQGYNVFLSSHKVVRNQLLKHPALQDYLIELYCCFPSKELKELWINKLLKRYKETNSQKDFKAYRNALDCYDENIEDLVSQTEFNQVIINDIDYDLEEELKKAGV